MVNSTIEMAFEFDCLFLTETAWCFSWQLFSNPFIYAYQNGMSYTRTAITICQMTMLNGLHLVNSTFQGQNYWLLDQYPSFWRWRLNSKSFGTKRSRHVVPKTPVPCSIFFSHVSAWKWTNGVLMQATVWVRITD